VMKNVVLLRLCSLVTESFPCASGCSQNFLIEKA
jgi:hypothetical protein